MDRRKFLPTYHYEDNSTGNLVDSVGKALRDYHIYGECVQDGTPTPEAPIDIQSVGDNTINLCPINTIRKRSTSRWAYQNLGKLELVPGKYTVKCHYKQYGTPTKVQISVRDYDELNTAYGYSAYYGLVEDDALVSFTLPTTAKGIQILLYINATANAIDTDCEFTNIMLVKGAYTAETIPDYEPFGYKVPIKVTGKNLFDAETHFNNAYEAETMSDFKPTKGVVDGVECYKYWGRNVNADTPDSVRYVNCGFKENTQYTLSLDRYDIYYNNYPGINLQIYYTDDTFSYASVVYTNRDAEKTWKHHTFTSAANKTIDHITWSFSTGAAQTYFANFQVEEGTVETDYEPYKDLGTTNIYLDEPLRAIEGFADYIDFKNQCVVRKLDEMVFNGTENWRATTEIIYIGLPTVSGEYVYGGSSRCLSTHIKSYASAVDNEFGFYSVSSVVRLYKKSSTYTDVDGWKAFLAEEYANGNPVKLILPYSDIGKVTEPIELPSILTAKGTINIIVDTDIKPSSAIWQYYRK